MDRQIDTHGDTQKSYNNDAKISTSVMQGLIGASLSEIASYSGRGELQQSLEGPCMRGVIKLRELC